MVFTSKHGHNLYYETHNGNNSQQWLVLLNGLSQSTIAWGLCLPFLKKYNVLLMDFRFQGQSSKEGEWQDFDAHAQDLNDLLGHLQINRVNIAGLSYGSLVAQHFAVRYPEKLANLMLMSSFCAKTPYYEAIETSWWRSLEAGGYPLLLDVMLPVVLSENYFKNPLIPIELMKQARKEANDDAAALFKLMRATKERPDYRNELSKINAATLVIHGEKDLLFPLHMGEEVAKNIKGARFEIVHGAGHTLNLEGVPVVCKLISDFVG